MRETETDRDRQTDRQRQTNRDREKQRERQRQTESGKKERSLQMAALAGFVYRCFNVIVPSLLSFRC